MIKPRWVMLTKNSALVHYSFLFIYFSLQEKNPLATTFIPPWACTVQKFSMVTLIYKDILLLYWLRNQRWQTTVLAKFLACSGLVVTWFHFAPWLVNVWVATKYYYYYGQWDFLLGALAHADPTAEEYKLVRFYVAMALLVNCNLRSFGQFYITKNKLFLRKGKGHS